jgi:hypothetical protein
MITTLYLIGIASWYTFSTFEGEQQVKDCLVVKEHIELNFPVEATCVTQAKELLIQDNIIYKK